MKLYLIVCLVFFLLGLYIIVIELLKKRRCSIPSKAKIINIIYLVPEDKKKRKNTQYKAVYEYEANDKKINIEGIRSFSTPGKYNIGDEIDLFYNPKKIREYYTKTESRIIPGIIICVITLVFASVILL